VRGGGVERMERMEGMGGRKDSRKDSRRFEKS
jgi:hypothetical protein